MGRRVAGGQADRLALSRTKAGSPGGRSLRAAAVLPVAAAVLPVTAACGFHGLWGVPAPPPNRALGRKWKALAITVEFTVVTGQWRGLLPTGTDLCCPSCPRLTRAG